MIAVIGIGGLAVLARQHADARRAVEEIRRRRRLPAEQLREPDRAGNGLAGGFVAAPGTATYHLPACVFVAGRADVRPVARIDGLRACQVCVASTR